MHVKSLKAKRSEETREALVAVATRIFGERGFAGAATEEIVAEAGVTRGALYHHFADKKELFAAVAEDLERCLCDRIAADVVGSTDARSMLEGGTDSFLAACLDPVLRQVLMIDAPSVLGWLRWRERALARALRRSSDLVRCAAAAAHAKPSTGSPPRQPTSSA